MKKQQSEILRDAIEEMVAIGELKPGQYLGEDELAKRFGVSRTPIREALVQLGSVGIVEIRPRRRTRVAQFDPHLLVEMFEVMAELEAMCGRLAARRMMPEELEELALANEDCRSALSEDQPDAYYYANERFHELLYLGSKNRCLIEQAKNLHRRLRPYRRLQLRLRSRVSQSFDEHCAIVQALQEHDEKMVDSLLRTHITMHTQRFSELMAFLTSMKPPED